MSEWIDECQISEAARLYGFDHLEIDPGKVGKHDDGEEGGSVSEDSVNDDIPLQDRVDSRLFVSRETDTGETLWRRPIEESDTIANHIAASNKLRYRLPCHSFRSMLPPFADGTPPARGPIWLTHCVRGILFAALQSFSESRAVGCIDSNFCGHLRFPEYAYCWFASDNEQSSNDDRWAFYNGVKLGRESSPDCWIVYQLLDDMQGEDFFSFLSDTVGKIREQIGDLLSSQAMESQAQLIDIKQQNGFGLDDDDSIASSISLPIDVCREIINDVFRLRRIMASENVQTMVNELLNNITEASTVMEEVCDGNAAVSPDETRGVAPSIDAFLFLQMTMKTYIALREKRLTWIRLMFETASEGVLTDFYDAQKKVTSGEKGPSKESSAQTINISQLYQILKSCWPSTTIKECALIYREAYDALYPPSQWSKPAPDGIDFPSFLVAAERHSLFSRATNRSDVE